MFYSPFIRPNDGKTQLQRQKAALHYSLFFNSIVLKYAVFSKNNCLFDWCAGFLMIFKERFFFHPHETNHCCPSRTEFLPQGGSKG